MRHQCIIYSVETGEPFSCTTLSHQEISLLSDTYEQEGKAVLVLDQGMSFPTCSTFYIEQEAIVEVAPSVGVFNYSTKEWNSADGLTAYLDALNIEPAELIRIQRANAYPPMGDQLDAIFKLAKYLQDRGEDLPEEVNDWIQLCQHVKNTYAAI